MAPVGAAAGLAAAFNAPITAVLFVIEEVIGRWSAGILGAVVLSAISSVVVERWFMGDEPLFRVPLYHLDHAGELLAYAVLGVVGGVASLVFVKVIKHLRPRLRRLPQWSQYVQPGVAGMLIGFIAIWYPQVMGAGYEWIDLAMHNRFPWEVLGIIAGLKLVSTVLSFATGTPGGLFAPVVFMGAMLGGGVGMAGAAVVSGICGAGGSLRAGWHGRAVCRNSARADDLGLHDPGGERQLLDHFARDDLQQHLVPDLAGLPAGAAV